MDKKELILSAKEQVNRIDMILNCCNVVKCECGLEYLPMSDEAREFCPECGEKVID